MDPGGGEPLFATPLPWFTPEEADGVRAIVASCSETIADHPHAASSGSIKILRFLQFHGGHVGKATAGFRAALAWRAEHMPESRRAAIVAKQHWYEVAHGGHRPTIAAMPGSAFTGFDKDGNILACERPGCFNVRALFKDGRTVDDNVAYSINLMEWLNIKLDQRSRDLGKQVWCVRIADQKGFGFGHIYPAAMKTVRRVLKTMHVAYPEMYRPTNGQILLNVPWPFRVAFGMVQYIIPARARQRICFQASVEDLDACVGLENVPEQWGGRVPSGDPRLYGVFPPLEVEEDAEEEEEGGGGDDRAAAEVTKI